MAWTFDQTIATQRLADFFKQNGGTARDFGNRVCQTFEATTFAQVIKWYQDKGWKVEVVNPKVGNKRTFRLKYSTKGDARNFTYVRCTDNSQSSRPIQIRHQIRIETFYNLRKKRSSLRANIVCDVAVLVDGYYDHIVGNMHVENEHLITFAEAKHMNAYAELVASFVGIVHELQPWRIGHDVKKRRRLMASHPKPFLNLSGVCMGTAEGIKETMRRRKLDVDVHDSTRPFVNL